MFQRIFITFYCLFLAVVLLNLNPLEFLKYLYLFLSYVQNKFVSYFSNIILILSLKNIFFLLNIL